MVSWDVPEPVVREVLPHPSVHVVLERGQSRVAGVPRGRFTRRLEGKGLLFGIKFRPGGFRPFVPFPISRITDRVLPLEEVFGEGGAGLEDAVLSEPAMPGRIAAATGFLRDRQPRIEPIIDEVAAAVGLILRDPRIRSVDELARMLGLRIYGGGVRALQRLFRGHVGMSPKWVIRRYRLHEAMERMDAGKVVDWPALALDLGTFDQAHFIRDFRTLVGRTPADYGRIGRR